MASPASFTRSAARATSSAYRRLPIRWRLAGGSAALTLVILCGFAVIVGVLTTRRIHDDFNRQVAQAADDLQARVRGHLQVVLTPSGQALECVECPNLTDYAASQDAVVRIVYAAGEAIRRGKSRGAPFLGPPVADTFEFRGYRIESRPVEVVYSGRRGSVYVQYARRLSDVDATAARVRFFLGLGVVGGAALALLAGLATARRAMSPIAELSEAARRIEEARDPSLELPKPTSKDEVAELASTLESMLQSLDAARTETESMLARQREFVADASHELRTPLTSVLANLELLEAELAGEQREVAASALRSTRRMRRLVADLLLLARADAGRVAPHTPLDLADVVVEAAAELEPQAVAHHIVVDAAPGAIVDGARDELHRLVSNLLENAIKHTPAGTEIRAGVRRTPDGVVLTVADDGPGVPPELRERIFERFVRGGSDRSGSSGLGLAIVRAVAESHGGKVTVSSPAAGGTSFVVSLPAGSRTYATEPPVSSSA